MKKPLKWLIAFLSSVLLVALTTFVTWFITKERIFEEIGLITPSYFSIEHKVTYIEGFENKYASFLDDEKAEYICRVSSDFGVDPDLVVAILEKENPTLTENATSKENQNGTRDLGLFQLNDRSLFSSKGFLELWWKDEFGEFNADNWKHNTYIAVKYIQDLTKTFGSNAYYVAAGYNAGMPRAFKAYSESDNSILPVSTMLYYAPTVENNYKKWKQL